MLLIEPAGEGKKNETKRKKEEEDFRKTTALKSWFRLRWSDGQGDWSSSDESSSLVFFLIPWALLR
jgi:hypothetical protein